MSNCTQQLAGCQKGRPIKAGHLYYMKLLLITQSQKQKTNRQKYKLLSFAVAISSDEAVECVHKAGGRVRSRLSNLKNSGINMLTGSPPPGFK